MNMILSDRTVAAPRPVEASPATEVRDLCSKLRLNFNNALF